MPNPERASKPRGNPAEAFKNSAVKVEAEYTIPIEHHNPMEPHGAMAFWEGDKLTIFDKSQNVYSVRGHLAAAFGIPEENVSVISLICRRRVRFVAASELLSVADGDGGA